MKKKYTNSRKIFIVCNYIILSIAALLCILPFINLLAVSLSNTTAVSAGEVKFIPVGFTLKSYEFVIKSREFMRAVGVSLKRVFLGVSVNMLLTVLTAYPLSKEKKAFKWRGFYAWFFMITMLFNAGLIPWYMSIKYTGLIDTIWALIIPGALPVFNMLVVLNFFRGLPKELEEAAFIDGAGHWKILWSIYLPLSKPSLATVALFCIVRHWNSWFDGLILMNKSIHYPLQSYLQTIIIKPEVFLSTAAGKSNYRLLLQFVNARTTRAAQIFIAMIPIMLVYPFLQKYFTTGLVLGSVKG
jgi:putative aldouronate transport system permease protein